MIEAGGRIGQEAVARHYDELDPFYRALWGEHVHHGYWATGRESAEEAAEALIALLAQEVGIAPGDRVCDIGCGYGATAAWLARTRGAEVTGVTLSPVQAGIAAARAAADRRLAFRCGDWLATDLPEETFDAAIAVESTEHMADKEAAFARAFRVLRPGGRLGICAWLEAPSPAPWQRRLLLEPICREGRLPAMGSEADYRRFLAGAGFTDIACRDLTRRVERTWSICIRRLLHALATDPAARAYLRDARATDRVFALTLPRILLAYRTGAMRYGLFTATRPPA
jgi:tocopherol O-methyltransferase